MNETVGRRYRGAAELFSDMFVLVPTSGPAADNAIEKHKCDSIG